MLGGSLLEGIGKVLKGGERAWGRAVELGRAAHAGEATLYGERVGSKFIGQAEAKEIRMANAARDVERVKASKAARAARKTAGSGGGRKSRVLGRLGRAKNRVTGRASSLGERISRGVRPSAGEGMVAKISPRNVDIGASETIGNLRKEEAARSAGREKHLGGVPRPKINLDGQARPSIEKTVKQVGLVGREPVSGVVHTPPPKSKAGFGRSGKAATRKQLNSANSMTSDTRFGRGLATMRRHKIKSTLVAGAGLGVAAKIRSTGSGTSRGNTSFYSH